ncbi:MAG: hypothetical protein ACLFUJ_14890 [Phycisphaerae bacterium]
MPLKLTELECKGCGAPLGADAVSEKLMLVRCKHCGCVFALESVPAATPTPIDPPRRQVPLPKGMEMFDRGNELQIVRSWKSIAVLFLIPFAAFWCGFLLFWYSSAIGSGAPIVFVLFPLIHVAVGVGLVYFIFACLLNKTVLRVTPNHLEVKHTPLPWPGGKTLNSVDIEQLFCRRRIRHSDNSTSQTYEVLAVTVGGQEKILSGLTEAEQGVFVEQQIEKYLGITDRRIGDPDEVAY